MGAPLKYPTKIELNKLNSPLSYQPYSSNPLATATTTTMSRFSLLFVLIAGLFAAAIAGAATFDDENPIRQVVVSEDVENRILQVVGKTPDALSFARFAIRHRKRYESVEEIKQRFEIFLDNLNKIQSHNNKGLSYKLGVNAFSDLTWDEFRRAKLGAPQFCSATKKANLKLTHLNLPERKDWREAGIVSPVKDQGDCGSCWTFSTTGALEAAYAQAFDKQVSLSEQQLVDCGGAFNNFGCNGGLPSQAFEYIKYNGGIETEESYPYTGKDSTCKFSPENVAVKVIDSFNITEGDETQLKYAVALIRPVSVAFEVLDDFRQYQSGVYSSSECGSGPLDVNHAVLAVGYGIENGIHYWLIKNSWGADWGDHGYFKMEMGKNMCGVATCASFPIVG